MALYAPLPLAYSRSKVLLSLVGQSTNWVKETGTVLCRVVWLS